MRVVVILILTAMFLVSCADDHVGVAAQKICLPDDPDCGGVDPGLPQATEDYADDVEASFLPAMPVYRAEHECHTGPQPGSTVCNVVLDFGTWHLNVWCYEDDDEQFCNSTYCEDTATGSRCY